MQVQKSFKGNLAMVPLSGSHPIGNLQGMTFRSAT